MAYRNGGRVEFEDRETVISERERDRPFRRPPPREEIDIYERREERRSASRGPPPVRERERERDFGEVDVRIRERERDSSRVPAFMREDPRRSDAGPLVLRQREVETMERHRRRSPSPPPMRVRETRLMERTRSVSPPPRGPPPRRVEEDIRIRTLERERVRSPSRGPPMERIRTRVVERERERSPSPPPVPMERIRTRIVERGRSPSPIDRERERIRIIERERERMPSPSPSPSPPPPPIVRGPTIEREVITHYRDIDHGIIPAPRPPSPPPPPRRTKERDTEIDIYTSRNATEVDIHKSSRRGRSISHERPSPARISNDELIVRSDRNRLEVDFEERRTRRAHSAAPPAVDYDDEAEYITDRIDSRGRMGEAYGGITKDWTIVDVPPGTERVRMDGVGGASAEVTWQKYSGVRRAKFIPERERERDALTSVSASSTSVSEERLAPRERERRLSVQIYDKEGRDREREIDVEKVTDRRISIRGKPSPPPAPRRSEMWTEITKDLICREAIEELGYEYEETEFFFYVMEYLRYEDVLELVQLSDSIRRARKDRVREIQWEREVRDNWDRDRRRRHHRYSRSIDRYEDERVVEREVVYDRAPPVRGYLR